jgi:hypothetical protein
MATLPGGQRSSLTGAGRRTADNTAGVSGTGIARAGADLKTEDNSA